MKLCDQAGMWEALGSTFSSTERRNEINEERIKGTSRLLLRIVMNKVDSHWSGPNERTQGSGGRV